MRFLLRAIFVFLGASLGAFSPAEACGMEPVPQAIVFGSPPEERPDVSVVLRVQLVEHIEESHLSIVNVQEGPSTMVGKSYRLAPDSLSSCTTFGRADGYVIVAPKTVPSDRGSYLSAFTYTRSWFDVILSILFVEPYRWAGSLYDDPVLSNEKPA